MAPGERHAKGGRRFPHYISCLLAAAQNYIALKPTCIESSVGVEQLSSSAPTSASTQLAWTTAASKLSLASRHRERPTFSPMPSFRTLVRSSSGSSISKEGPSIVSQGAAWGGWEWGVFLGRVGFAQPQCFEPTHHAEHNITPLGGSTVNSQPIGNRH